MNKLFIGRYEQLWLDQSHAVSKQRICPRLQRRLARAIGMIVLASEATTVIAASRMVTDPTFERMPIDQVLVRSVARLFKPYQNKVNARLAAHGTDRTLDAELRLPCRASAPSNLNRG
jgi:hypothetical protein